MQILVVSATSLEIKPIYEAFNKKIDFLITGIGIPQSTFKLTNKLNETKYDLVINLGIAGSFNRDFELGKVVQVTEDCFADIGFEAMGSFIPISQSKIAQNQKNKFTNNYNFLFLKEIESAKGITVNSTSGNAKTINYRQRIFNADVESMEGASIFYVCTEKNINFIEIRSISNYIEERNTNNWNIPLAISNLNKYASKLISELLEI